MTISVKKIDFLKYFSLIALFVGIILIPIASAAGSSSDFPSYMLNQINEGVTGVIQKTLTNEDGTNKFYTLMVSNNTDEMSSTINAAMTIVTAYACLKVLGSTIASAARSVERGIDVTETAFKSSAGFLMRMILVTRVRDILALITDLGISFIGLVCKVSPTVAVDSITLSQLTGREKGGITWWIQTTVILLIPFVLSIMMSLTATFTSYSILIEIGIRKAFSPLGIVSIFDDGFRGPGMRSVKKYLAVFIRIAICLIVCKIGSELMTAALQEVLDGGNVLDKLSDCFMYILTIIGINMSILAFINKGSEIANDYLGA